MATKKAKGSKKLRRAKKMHGVKTLQSLNPQPLPPLKIY